jgi:hypothetical protein
LKKENSYPFGKEEEPLISGKKERAPRQQQKQHLFVGSGEKIFGQGWHKFFVVNFLEVIFALLTSWWVVQKITSFFINEIHCLWCLGEICFRGLKLDVLLMRLEVVRQGFKNLIKR